MKRILLIISILLIAVSASGMMLIGGKPVIDAGCSIPESADVSYEADFDTTNALQTDAEGQTFDSGTGGNLAKICVSIWASSAGTVDIRIGDGKNLTDGNDLIEDLGTTESITLGSCNWICIESTANPTLSASTSYVIGVSENSGDIYWCADGTNGYADGIMINGSSVWQLGNDNATVDNFFRVDYCD